MRGGRLALFMKCVCRVHFLDFSTIRLCVSINLALYSTELILCVFSGADWGLEEVSMATLWSPAVTGKQEMGAMSEETT